jgi:hypothetical protein
MQPDDIPKNAIITPSSCAFSLGLRNSGSTFQQMREQVLTSLHLFGAAQKMWKKFSAAFSKLGWSSNTNTVLSIWPEIVKTPIVCDGLREFL